MAIILTLALILYSGRNVSAENLAVSADLLSSDAAAISDNSSSDNPSSDDTASDNTVSDAAVSSDTVSDNKASEQASSEIVSADEALSVELPTSAALDFIIDPLGVSFLGRNGTLNISDAAIGYIIPKDGTGARFVNHSPADVVVSVSLSACAVPGIVFSTSKDAVSADEAPNLLLAIVASTVSGSGISDFSPASSGVVSDAAGNISADFIIHSEDSTMFRIGGYANPKADWSSYMKEYPVTVSAVFNVSKASEYDIAGSDVYGHGLRQGTPAADIAIP